MTGHTPAEQACFDALVAHNKPLTTDDPPYPACLWAIAEAATAAVKEALDQDECEYNPSLMPTDVTEWLRIHGWTRTGSLGDIAERWQNQSTSVLVPMLTTSPDFSLRWSEMLERLAGSLDTDPAGVLLAIAKSGSDIAEFRALDDQEDQ